MTDFEHHPTGPDPRNEEADDEAFLAIVDTLEGDIDTDCQPLDEAQQEFTDSRTALYNQVAVTAKEPNLMNAGTLDELNTASVESFRRLITQLVDANVSFESNVERLITVLVDTERDRAAVLSFMTGMDFSALEAEDVKEIFTDHFDDDHEESIDPTSCLVSLPVSVYESRLEEDLVRFAGMAKEQHESSPQQKRKRLLKNVGKHALDVAKIGLGIAAGVVAAHQVIKRR